MLYVRLQTGCVAAPRPLVWICRSFICTLAHLCILQGMLSINPALTVCKLWVLNLTAQKSTLSTLFKGCQHVAPFLHCMVKDPFPLIEALNLACTKLSHEGTFTQ